MRTKGMVPIVFFSFGNGCDQSYEPKVHSMCTVKAQGRNGTISCAIHQHHNDVDNLYLDKGEWLPRVSM